MGGFFSKFLFYLLLPIVSIVVGLLVMGALHFINHGFQKWPAVIRWLLFLPISLIMMMITFGAVWIMNYNDMWKWLLTFVANVGSMVVFFLVLYNAIPKYKKTISVIISLIWILLCAYEIFFMGTFVVRRIVQIIIAVIFMVIAIKNENELNMTEQQDESN